MKDNLFKIHSIFNIFISCCFLDVNKKDIIDYVKNLKKNNKGRKRSNIGGWQSNDLILNNKTLIPLVKEIENAVSVYGKNVNFKKNITYKICDMWANINNYKDFNVPHIHPNSLISGVFYLKTPKNCGNIAFMNPSQNLMDHTWLDKFKDNFTEVNSSVWFREAKEGLLYLFPSWLLHSVEPNTNKKEERISISFNTQGILF